MVIDIEKVEAAKRGDKDMFAQVYDSVAPDLYRVALYTLCNPHDAEDVVSETFMEAYKGIRQLRDSSKFKSWIMKILSARIKRKISDYIKNKPNMDLEAFSATIYDASDLVADMTEHVTIAQALERLTEQERHIISLAVMQGYTTKETSQILGCPHGTVSSKLHRSLIKLRKMIEPPEASESSNLK